MTFENFTAELLPDLQRFTVVQTRDRRMPKTWPRRR
jgi:hypothetical protein